MPVNSTKTTLKKDKLLIALEERLGLVSLACKDVGIDRGTYYDWLESDPEFKKAVESINDVALDFAENSLISQIQGKVPVSTIFYLKTKGKKRGYIEGWGKDESKSGAPKSIIFGSEVTRVYIETLRNIGKKKIIVSRGGARSSKTTSTAQILVDWLFTGFMPNVPNDFNVISIVRATLPALKKSVLRDLERIISEKNLPIEHKISDKLFTFGGRTLEYFSADNSDKVKGSKRGILYVNEANEVPYEIIKQLLLRTQHTAIFDFNPDDENTWLRTEIEDKRARELNDVVVIRSTFLDNIFLDEGTRQSLEAFRLDAEYWRVFGEGEYATFSGLVYPKETWATFDRRPQGKYYRQFALDFGYSPDPTAIVLQEFSLSTMEVYETEICYDNNLSTSEIGNIIKAAGYSGELVVCDNSERREIAELTEMGLNAYGPAKETILKGIKESKRFKRYVHSDSANFQTELRRYKTLKDAKTGNYTNEPLDKFNHLLDASRYGILQFLKDYGHIYHKDL